jgi:thiosulfate/3-mercaptopyruvate sulfurtransferase
MFKVRLLPWLALPALFVGGRFATGSPMFPQEKTKAEAFANPGLLLTTAWLEKHGKDSGVVVLDARSPKDFAAGHVPGALNLSTAETYDPKVRGNIGSVQQIAGLLGTRGIQTSSHVVIYDGGRSIAAARLFWTLEVYGHAKVSVLDGGVAKWKHEKRPLTTDLTEAKAAVYKVAEHSVRIQAKRCSTLDQLLDDVEDPEVVMLDARSEGEFKSGRIPAAVRIEWMHNYTSDAVPVFKSPAALAKLYKDQGVTPDKRVHAY